MRPSFLQENVSIIVMFQSNVNHQLNRLLLHQINCFPLKTNRFNKYFNWKQQIVNIVTNYSVILHSSLGVIFITTSNLLLLFFSHYFYNILFYLRKYYLPQNLTNWWETQISVIGTDIITQTGVSALFARIQPSESIKTKPDNWTDEIGREYIKYG